ncbi:cell division protein FtsX [Sphingomonas montana]|uniref:cell division protein FtsX n=1 Tax=Sphingomonas montana TaxID=1843236 RepID=UPI00096DCE9A|nr:FtsX-like permease family protein [Sphingomonas montana]
MRRLTALFPSVRAADRRLLREGRLSGPMPWVLAVMLFLTTLAAAGGLALGQAAQRMGGGLETRATVQIVQADADARERQAAVTLTALRGDPAVRSVERVGAAEMAALLEPWLGAQGTDDLPLPVLIDVGLTRADAVPDLARTLARVAPDARIDDHRAALAPVSRLIGTLRWLALAIVLLMTAATGFVVVLAAASALDTHRGTIDVMHLLGATDIQVARLFQRRIALDALFAGLIGLGAGMLVLTLIGRQLAGLESELVGAVALPAWGGGVLVALPLATTLLAAAAARWTVVRALGRLL